ncbi:PQQ-binding-like beta-propeller repeat protein [Streptomyces sp. XM4193]|uniref:serine/threonine-protein kinase n=1 Tax=Streptomyces sp. XM4193 TaxID=2929782 RepID=UPI001FF8C58E|nr:serine/threonine-protein kinase [Streptomyces sp. XM4193]MCK1794471.1 PQQ-binding-like beta-propeller repeat protein [Streptomyces sp. XM4193]
MRQLEPEDPSGIGEYRLLARLGSGGMGLVFLGRSPGGRLVAVKLVRDAFRHDARYRARFAREVAAARQVTGAFTAALVDAEPEADTPWLAMEYLPGLTLRAAVQEHGALPPDAVRLLASALSEALADIHRAGLTHRDLKPANIMLTASGPRLIDFGIARPVDATAITLHGTLLGTPGFMSPEQASGGHAEQPSDVFSLGAVAAYAATGREPFAAPDRAATLARVRSARADLGGVRDQALRSVIDACLRREPSRRPTAAGVLRRLGRSTASVYGTGWLPAPHADAVDRRTAGATGPPLPAPPPGSSPGEPHGGGHGQASDKWASHTGSWPNELPARPPAADAAADATADSTELSGTDGAVESPGVSGTPVRPRHQHRLGRRQLLLAAVAALPTAGALALALDESLPPGDGEDSSSKPSPRTGRPEGSRGKEGTSGGEPRPTGTGTPRPERRWERTPLEDPPSGAGELDLVDGVLVQRYGRSLRAVAPSSGRTLWKRTADDRNTGSPVGHDTVYAYDPRKGDSTADFTLRALDATSGATRWTSRVPFFPAATAAGGTLVVVDSPGGVRALDSRDGAQRWRTADSGHFNLAVHEDHLVLARDRTLVGANSRDGRTRWSRKLRSNPVRLLVADRTVLACDNAGTVYAVDLASGERLWDRTFDYRYPLRFLGGGAVYVPEPDGRLRALRLETGDQLWSVRPDSSGSDAGGTADGPAQGRSEVVGLDGDTVWFTGTDLTLYALDTGDGRIRWSLNAEYPEGISSSSPTVLRSPEKVLRAGGLLVVSSAGGRLEALEPPAEVHGGADGSA